MNYGLSYREKHNLNESALTDAQRTLHYIAENMRIEKSISEDGYKHFQQAIEALEQKRWIPVSERLPEDDEDVLVCNSQGVIEVDYYHIDDTVYPPGYKDLNETGWYDEDDNALYLEPIAWMPLPTPFKAESEE